MLSGHQQSCSNGSSFSLFPVRTEERPLRWLCLLLLHSPTTEKALTAFPLPQHSWAGREMLLLAGYRKGSEALSNFKYLTQTHRKLIAKQEIEPRTCESQSSYLSEIILLIDHPLSETLLVCIQTFMLNYTGTVNFHSSPTRSNCCFGNKIKAAACSACRSRQLPQHCRQPHQHQSASKTPDQDKRLVWVHS